MAIVNNGDLERRPYLVNKPNIIYHNSDRITLTAYRVKIKL